MHWSYLIFNQATFSVVDFKQRTKLTIDIIHRLIYTGIYIFYDNIPKTFSMLILP